MKPDTSKRRRRLDHLFSFFFPGGTAVAICIQMFGSKSSICPQCTEQCNTHALKAKFIIFISKVGDQPFQSQRLSVFIHFNVPNPAYVRVPTINCLADKLTVMVSAEPQRDFYDCFTTT